MKKRMHKWMALLLTVLLITSVFPGSAVTALAAKTPTLSLSSKTLNGIGSTFTLSIKNLDKSKVKSTTWYTTNKKIVTVNAKTGYVTAVGKGTAYIKNKIVYKDGTILRPSCKVTVKIPATGIKITNTPPEGMDYFTLTVGETIDFNAVLTPSDSTDLITYTVDNPNCATVDKKGIVTAINSGYVVLKATASATKAAASTSKVQDIVKINILPKTVGVKSAVLTDTTTITITFDQAMNGSTIFDSNGQLLEDSVSIRALANSDGKVADKLGTLTGKLSSDGKTLTITSENAFNGNYVLHLTGNIRTADGTALSEYYKDLNLVDKTPPTFKSYKVDDTGLVATIEFSEPMDFTNMAVSKVSLVKAGETADASTLSLLKTKTNYIVSEDKKSLVIDLSSIPSTDHNKTFSVVFSGLKDKSGNYPANSIITAYVATDTTPKAQAQLLSLTRTGYYTLTATFNRAIQTPGIVVLSNGVTIDGEVSKTDKKVVNYTLDATSAKLTGSQKVSIGYWDSYNVRSTDTSANKLTERVVNFTVSTTGPQLKTYKLTTETKNNTVSYVLTLTYDKTVVLSADSGKFNSRLVAANDDITNQKILTYTATVKDKVITVVLNKEQFNTNGTYTITIPEGFVKDNFNNASKKSEITINRTGTTGTGLPAPEKIEQSSTDYSLVYVTFAHKLDKASAENVGNYSILGVTITKAELIENSANGAVVQLTLNTGSVSVSATYAVIIKGIKGYADSYTAMEKYETVVFLNENKAPVITKIAQTAATTITITFDEEITGTADFSVMQKGIELASSSMIEGNCVYIFLTEQPTKGVSVTITPTATNAITDLSGNKLTLTTRYLTPTY